jgi:hypothetical protein
LVEEMADLERVLRMEPFQHTHPYPDELKEQIEELYQRDAKIHPVVEWEIRNEKTITVTEEEHRALLEHFKTVMRHRWTDRNMEDALESRRNNGGRWWPLAMKLGQQSSKF